MFNNKQMFAHKLIQTREIEKGCMKIGCVLNLITEFDGNKATKSEPYYFVGNTGNTGYFIHADIVDERSLLSFKKILEKENSNVIRINERKGRDRYSCTW